MGYKKLFFSGVILFASFSVRAQVWELGIQAGGAGYMGDLNPYNPVKISGLHGGLFAKANFDAYWALGLHFNMGKVAANDANSTNEQFRQRNLSFNNSLKELSLQVDFNFLDYFAGGGYKKISPYLYAGVGAVFFAPKANYQGTEYNLALYTTEQVEYKKVAVAVPFGAGVKYNIGGKWSLLGNIGYRNAYTDYLDDVSGVYPGGAAFDNTSEGLIQRALSDRSGENTGIYIGNKDVQRGDFRKRDSYMFVGIGITYTFVSQKCF